MTTHTIVALVARRAELAGELHTVQSRLHELHAALASLDDVIKQFDPDYRIDAIRPRYRKQATPAETASISRAVLDTLRRAPEPMTAKQIALTIITDRALNRDDRGLVRSISKRVDMALRYQRTNGMVEATETEAGVRWAIAD